MIDPYNTLVSFWFWRFLRLVKFCFDRSLRVIEDLLIPSLRGHAALGYRTQCWAAEWWPLLLLGSVKKKQLLVNVIPDRVTGLLYLVSCAHIIPERNVQFNPFFLFLPGHLSGHLERNLKVPDLKFPLCFPLGHMHPCSFNWERKEREEAELLSQNKKKKKNSRYIKKKLQSNDDPTYQYYSTKTWTTSPLQVITLSSI